MSKKTDYPTLPVEALVPYERNPRTHSDAQIQQIIDILTEMGFINPLIIDENNMVLAGHGRLIAAKKMGLTEVPVRKVTHLTDAQKRAYVIADNKLPLNSGWNQDLLSEELAALTDADFSLEVTGFDFRELDAMAVFVQDEDHAALEEGIIELGKGKEMGRPAAVAPLLSFGTYRIPMQAHEIAALEAKLKQYEDTYGLHQGFVGWLTDAAPGA